MANPILYQANQYNRMSAIVDHVLFMNSLPNQWFQWFLEAGLWGLRELNLDVWQDVKTVLLDVTDRRTATLPSDYVDWTKIGVQCGQYIVTLGVNDKLNLLDRTEPPDFINGLFSQNIPNGINFNSYGGYYFFTSGGAVPSFGGGFFTKGQFKVAKINGINEILLDFDFLGSQVLVEYITDGFDPSVETIVDPYFADYVEKCMEFKWEEKKNPDRTEASIRRKAMDMYDSLRKVRARKNNLDPQTILNITRSAVRFTPHI